MKRCAGSAPLNLLMEMVIKKQLPMWHVYRVELYPHYGSGPGTGIISPAGHERLFPAAFRHHRTTDEEKGIVKVVPNQ